MTKKNKTWGIEEEIAEQFEEKCKAEGLLQNFQVEQLIKNWVEERK